MIHILDAEEDAVKTDRWRSPRSVPLANCWAVTQVTPRRAGRRSPKQVAVPKPPIHCSSYLNEGSHVEPSAERHRRLTWQNEGHLMLSVWAGPIHHGGSSFHSAPHWHSCLHERKPGYQDTKDSLLLEFRLGAVEPLAAPPREDQS